MTLFATLDSQTSAVLDGVCPRPYNEDPELDGRVWEAAVAAVPAALALDRARIAAVARQRFSVDRMVDKYLDVYERLLATNQMA